MLPRNLYHIVHSTPIVHSWTSVPVAPLKNDQRWCHVHVQVLGKLAIVNYIHVGAFIGLRLILDVERYCGGDTRIVQRKNLLSVIT